MQAQTGRSVRKWWLVGLALMLALVLGPGSARAVTFTVDHGTVSGSFAVDDVIIGATAPSTPPGVFTQTGDSTASNSLTVGRDTNSSGIYNLSSSSLSASFETIGNQGTGAFNQNGGSNTVNAAGYSYALALGWTLGSSGTYSLSGTGSLTVNGIEQIGHIGTGTFNQSGGTHTVNGSLILNSGGSATYSLSGTGSLVVNGDEFIGRSYLGTATFTQDGGSNTVSGTLFINRLGNNNGTYNLNGGSLAAAFENIGKAATGTFNQTGGSHTVDDGSGNGTLLIGQGGSGSYALSDAGGGSSLTVNGLEYIGDGGGTGTFTQSGGTHKSNELYLGSDVNSTGHAGTGSYTLNGGSLQVDYEYLGYAGTGSFTQNGGTHTVGDLEMGSRASGSGTYELKNNGSLQTTYETIGDAGHGTFTQTGGTNTASSDLTLGNAGSGSGTYTLSGGSLSTFFETIGNAGSGSFIQNGGTNTASRLRLGFGGSGSGTYDLSNTGSLTAGNEYVGYAGTGTFTQSGGTHTVTGNLYLGGNNFALAPGATGTYTLSNGSLTAANEYLGYNQGSGTFNQSGGTNTVGTLTLVTGGGSGTYNLSGTGSLTAGTVNLRTGGIFNQTGGTLDFTTFNQSGGTGSFTDLYLGRNLGNNSSYTLSGGSVTAAEEFIGDAGTGNFAQAGGTNTLSSLFIGTHTGSSGGYTLGGGSLSIGTSMIGFAGNGTFLQTGGDNVTGTMHLGSQPGSSGTYTLTDGSLSVAYEEIGSSGNGTFTQTGGTHTVTTSLALGPLVDGNGAYNLNGGSLSTIGMVIGVMGRGTFIQTDGIHNTNGTMSLGGIATGYGEYTLNGGSLSATNENIGYAGTGTFTQSGGSNAVTGALTLAANAGSSGTYNLSGGSLTAGTVNLNSGGLFNQTGGNLNATIFNQQGGEVQGSLENRGTFNYTSGLFSGRLLNYGAVSFNADFTAANGLANYSATPLAIDAGRSVTLNGAGLDNQGSLAVNGTLAANSLLNNTTGTLSGTGTIQGNLTNRGTLSPGNSPGTLNLVGSYTQAAAGTLTMEIASPTSYDKLNVTGSASLNGTLKTSLLGGYVPQGNQVFSVVTAAGGISGTFSSVTYPTLQSLTLSWQPRYTANSMDLLVARDYSNPGLNLTPNQRAVGNMLNGLAPGATGDLNNVLNVIDNLGRGSEVAGAFQQISADKAASLATLGFAAADLFRQGLANRITNLRYGGLGESGGLGGLSDLNLNGSCLDGLMLAYNSSSLAGLLTAKKKAAPETRWGVYVDPGLVLGSQKSSINQSGFDFTIAGFNAGADYRLRDDLLVGLASGYGHTGANLHGSGGSVENHTWPLSAYAAYLPESFYAFGSLGYALNLFNLERQITFGSIDRTPKSTTTGNQFNAYGEAGYDLKTSRLVMTPVVTLAYSSLWVNGFTESGAGSLNLKVNPQQAESLQTGVGAKLAAPLKRNSTVVVPQAYATYQHEFADGSRGLDAHLSQGSSTFAFQTDQRGRNFAVVGANVTIMPKTNFVVQLNYNAEVGRDKYTAQMINAGVRWEF